MNEPSKPTDEQVNENDKREIEKLACLNCDLNKTELSNQFFASGPFYAIDNDENGEQNKTPVCGERSSKCNVLYAEMAFSAEGKSQTEDSSKCQNDKYNSSCELTKFWYYGCPNSPFNLYDSLSNDNKVYFLPNDSCTHCSKPCTSIITSPIKLNKKKSPSSCKEETAFNDKEEATLNDKEEATFNDKKEKSNDTKNGEPNCLSNELNSNYTTVIKPKPLRPKAVNKDLRFNLKTVSFHCSTNMLSERDDSAFTSITNSITRRRSNSETTHYHHFTSNDLANKSLTHKNSSLITSDSLISKDADLKLRRNGIRNGSLKDFKQESKVENDEKSSIKTRQENVQRNSFDGSIPNNKDKRRDSNKFHTKSKIKSAFISLFRSRKSCCSPQSVYCLQQKSDLLKKVQDSNPSPCLRENTNSSPFTHRALPPLPSKGSTENANANHVIDERQKALDYAASIERVKDCGWYWGPISGEMAENLLKNEPDGSFIVRDSSDEHYIFSLTFKLNDLVRHVRIEHDQGNFSFGSLQKFRSNTIVDFIENAVEHSRSGRFLFFLHRRPVMGPMRVQLLHPVSRFKQIQSLQHLCRFIILKYVRRDHIDELPLPKMLKNYLNSPYYYAEEHTLVKGDESVSSEA